MNQPARLGRWSRGISEITLVSIANLTVKVPIEYESRIDLLLALIKHAGCSMQKMALAKFIIS